MKKLLLLILLCSLNALAQSTGDFSYSKQIDPISDKNTSTLILPAVSTNSFSSVYLVFRCNSDSYRGYDIFVSTDRIYLGGFYNNDVKVTHRFDSNKPTIQGWSVSTDKKGLFIYNATKDSFLKGVRVAKQLAYRFDHLGRTTTYLFNLSGSVNALKLLKCLPQR